METTTNAPLDGGPGELVDPAGKERFVTERQHYLNAVEGGLWMCNPSDDVEAMTTTFTCEQLSSRYELPPGYTAVKGSDGLDGDYPDQSNRMTYRNWSQISDGLTTGRLLDDPTNQTIILTGMIATAPALYMLGAAGDGVVDMLIEPPAQVVERLSIAQQIGAAASVPGVTLSSLIQTTTTALATTNNVTGPRLTQLTEFMEQVEGVLAVQPRNVQISILQGMGKIPYEFLEKDIMMESPDRFLSFVRVAMQMIEEQPIRQMMETIVRFSDLTSEDLRATALQTLSQQAIGTLPLENPTLANVSMRGLPNQIAESLPVLNEIVSEVDVRQITGIQLTPWGMSPAELGVDGISRIQVLVSAIIHFIDSGGVTQTAQVVYSLPVPVMQIPIN